VADRLRLRAAFADERGVAAQPIRDKQLPYLEVGVERTSSMEVEELEEDILGQAAI